MGQTAGFAAGSWIVRQLPGNQFIDGRQTADREKM
jgi:hypothetical protein